MPTRRRMRFVHGHLAWMLGTVLVLTLLGALSPQLVFVSSLVGLVVITELTAPFNVTPAWRARLPWLVGLGLVGFGAIVVARVLSILPPEVTPL